jgi:hypothetical protein
MSRNHKKHKKEATRGLVEKPAWILSGIEFPATCKGSSIVDDEPARRFKLKSGNVERRSHMAHYQQK